MNDRTPVIPSLPGAGDGATTGVETYAFAGSPASSPRTAEAQAVPKVAPPKVKFVELWFNQLPDYGATEPGHGGHRAASGKPA